MLSGSVTALLQQLPLFAGFPEQELAPLAAESHIHRFEAEAVVFRQGDACDRVWILHGGRVKIVYQEENGREMILEMISPGEAFGGAVLFLPQQPATARAMAVSEVVSLPSERYSQFLSDHPAAALKLVRMLGTRLHSMVGFQVLAGERVERRLAHILLKLADRLGQPDPEGVVITIPLARQDLADMAGTTLETTIRTVSRFRAQGLVKTRRGGYLVITDEARLRQQAQPS